MEIFDITEEEQEKLNKVLKEFKGLQVLFEDKMVKVEILPSFKPGSIYKQLEGMVRLLFTSEIDGSQRMVWVHRIFAEERPFTILDTGDGAPLESGDQETPYFSIALRSLIDRHGPDIHSYIREPGGTTVVGPWKNRRARAKEKAEREAREVGTKAA